MPSSALNTQTNRSIRYEQRCLKKRCEDQKKERMERAMKRDDIKNEISKEVASHITSEKRRMSSKMVTRSSFHGFFWM